MGMSRKPTPVVSLRNAVLLLTAAHFIRNVYLYAKNDVLIRFLLGLDLNKSRHAFRNGGEIFASGFLAHEVKYLFTSLEDSTHPLIQSCKDKDIKVVVLRSASNCIQAADFVFRVCKQPAVVFIPSAAGILEASGSILAAKQAQSGMLIIGESTPLLLEGRGNRQDLNQSEFLVSLVKDLLTVRSVRGIVGNLEAGFEGAKTGVCGPIFLGVARDVLYSQKEMITQYQNLIALNPAKLSWIAALGFRFHLAKTYATDSFHVRPAKALKIFPTKPHDFLVKKTVRLLKRSVRPVLLIGSQAVPSVKEVQDLQSSLVSLGIPMFLFGDAKGILGGESPLVHHRGLQQALLRSDLVILLGVQQDHRLGFGEYIPDETFVIAVNKSKQENILNRRPALSIISDAFLFIKNLQASTSFSHEVAARWNSWQRSITNLPASKNILGTPSQESLLKNLLSAMGEVSENARVIANGRLIESSASLFQPRCPFGWMESGTFGNENISAGFAVASGLIFENQELWVVDSSSNPDQALQEIELFLQNKWSAIFVLVREKPRVHDLSLPEGLRAPVLYPIRSSENCLEVLQKAKGEAAKGNLVIVDYSLL